MGLLLFVAKTKFDFNSVQEFSRRFDLFMVLLSHKIWKKKPWQVVVSDFKNISWKHELNRLNIQFTIHFCISLLIIIKFCVTRAVKSSSRSERLAVKGEPFRSCCTNNAEWYKRVSQFFICSERNISFCGYFLNIVGSKMYSWLLLSLVIEMYVEKKLNHTSSILQCRQIRLKLNIFNVLIELLDCLLFVNGAWY